MLSFMASILFGFNPIVSSSVQINQYYYCSRINFLHESKWKLELYKGQLALLALFWLSKNLWDAIQIQSFQAFRLAILYFSNYKNLLIFLFNRNKIFYFCKSKWEEGCMILWVGFLNVNELKHQVKGGFMPQPYSFLFKLFNQF